MHLEKRHAGRSQVHARGIEKGAGAVSVGADIIAKGVVAKGLTDAQRGRCADKLSTGKRRCGGVGKTGNAVGG